MVIMEKRIRFRAGFLYDPPILLFREIRRNIAEARNDDPELAQAELVDIGFLREKETVEVTLYFTSETQC